MIADNVRVKIQQANDLGLQIKSKIQEGKLIIKAYSLDDKIEYQGELQPNPYIDIQDIQELIDENKKIKIVTKTPNFIKIKVGATPIQLVGKQKIDLQNLPEAFEKVIKNQSLMQKLMKEQKEELNEHKDLIIGLKRLVEEIKLGQQERNLKSLKFQQTFIEEKLKLSNGIQQNLNEIKKIRQEMRSQIEQIKLLPESFKNLIDELKSKINKQCQIISTTVSQQSEYLQRHENQLKQLTSYLQSKITSPLQKLEQSLIQSRLNEPIRSCKWSEELKSNQITINNNVVTKTGHKCQKELCLLNASFPNTLKHKQSWTIKINKNRMYIQLGVCLKSKMLKYNFNSQNLTRNDRGHGLYMIDSFGGCYSHSQKQFNRKDKCFDFNDGDVIYIEYDPIDSKLRFSRNKIEYFEMPIIAPPQNDAYHPCVSLREQNDSIQLLSPQN